MNRFLHFTVGIVALFLLCANAWSDPIIGTKWRPFHLPNSREQVQNWKPGRTTVFSFCAFWCSTWKTQLPRLLAAKEALQGLPVDFVTISIDGRWVQTEKHNQGLPLWLDPGGGWSHRQGITRVPTTVVIDPKGIVRYVEGGVSRTADIIAAIRKAESPRRVDRTIYLTFDDFPGKSDNTRLLNLLFGLNVKATIFCIGDHIKPHLDVFHLAMENGDRLECHSWSHHANAPQLGRCWQEFYNQLGIEPTLFRPPGSEKVFGTSHYHPIVDPYDFQRPNAVELLRRVLSAVRSNAIIQLHAGVPVTIQVLPKMIKNLRSRGFHFRLLGTPNPKKPTSPPVAVWHQSS